MVGRGADCWHTDVRTRCPRQLCTKESYRNCQFSIFVLVIYQLELSHCESLIIETAVLKMQEPVLANVLNTHTGSRSVCEEKPYKGQKSALCVLCIRGPPLLGLRIMPVHEEQVFEIKSRGNHYEFSPSEDIARISKITLLRQIIPTSPDDFLSWGCTGDTKSSCPHKLVFRCTGDSIYHTRRAWDAHAPLKVKTERVRQTLPWPRVGRLCPKTWGVLFYVAMHKDE